MRKSFHSISILIAILLLFLPTPTDAKTDIPKEAKDYAAQHFLEIVHDLYQEDDPTLYGFAKEMGEITFGPLHPIHHFSQAFVMKPTATLSKNESIQPGNEWVATIYQNEKPVNVIGVYKNEEKNQYEFSTLGYGKELAEALTLLKPHEQLVYEFPVDAWYSIDGNQIRPLTYKGQELMQQPLSLASFRSLIVDRYQESKYLPDDALGGVGEKNETDPDHSFLWAAGVITPFIGFLFYRRMLRKNLQNGNSN